MSKSKSKKNKDGVEIGAVVDFSTILRVEAKKRSKPVATQDQFSEYSRAELEELLKAHGGDTSGTLQQLRERLTKIVYADL